MSRFPRLFDDAVSVAWGDPRLDWPTSAASAVENAVPARRREFFAGRALVREAMQCLGLPPQTVGVGGDRAPVWPSAVTGSISHCADLCAAAVARTADGIAALGLDIEPAEPLDADLVEAICRPAERDRLERRDRAGAGLLARAIFSAKECAYKCQYVLSKKLFDFHGMEVTLDLPRETFVARFTIDAAPFRAGDALHGRIAIAGGHIAAGMVLRHGQVSACHA